MTNWEKSCVEALITSPTAFALFRDKQKNKKHVDQFINKIWPYKIKKEFKEDNTGDKIFNSLLEKIMIIRSAPEKYDEIDTGTFNIGEITGEKLIKIFNKNITSTCKNPDGGNHIVKILFYAINGSAARVYIKHGVYDYKKEFTAAIKEDLIYSSIEVRAVDGRSWSDEIIDSFMSCVRKDDRNIDCHMKFKRAFRGQNVGIEIEYDGIWHNYLEKELIKTKNALSFNSGIDGGVTDGSNERYLMHERLRENRLRINGHRGLVALHFLLEEMNRTNSIMTVNSGMHFHIDLTHIIRKKSVDPDWSFVGESQLQIIYDIFEIKNRSMHIRSEIRFPTEFNTMEWRMGSPILNYSRLAIEILTAIHVTNVIMKKNKQINSEYLKCLLDIKTKLILK